MNNTNTQASLIETVTISGVKVLARTTKYGLSAKTFANRTQAYNAAKELQASGVSCWVRDLSRPFLVVIAEA